MEELITTGSSVLDASPSTVPIVEQPISKTALLPVRSQADPLHNITSSNSTTSIPSWMQQKPIHVEKYEWPPMDIVQHLVDIYFLHFETLSPIADVKGFKATILNKTCNAFLLYSILAVAAR